MRSHRRIVLREVQARWKSVALRSKLSSTSGFPILFYFNCKIRGTIYPEPFPYKTDYFLLLSDICVLEKHDLPLHIHPQR
jgi:hypothetical protein